MDLDSPLQTTGMSHALRYHQNLKVLRRRDPSITSIFDQFSHVCLYHHTATKWEKHGYEGSMFLYERDSYPPYGFYILNRMGMDDHIQPIYPEDTVGAHGSYLIIRSFPDFTKRRLAAVQASHPNEALDKFSDAYFVPDVESLTPAEKGHSRTIGLWMFSPDSRGPLFDTFSRLHDYIRKNEPYPQQFRFGPDRPPPSMTPAHVNQQPYGSLPSTPSVTIFNTQRQPTPNGGGASGALSDLDKLFAKLTPTPAPAPASTAASPPPFITGPKLLDTIFASASSSSVNLHPSSPYTSASTSTSTPNAPPIQAPLPTSRIAPQVLDQTTIAALLGLPPSRTPSATSTSRSTSGVSTAYSTDHSSSREGDDEDTSDSGYGYSGYSGYSGHGRGDSGVSNSNSDTDADADAYSESSTVLDPEAEWDTELQAAGASAGRPLVAEPAGVVNGHHGHGRVNGRRARGGHGHGNGHGHGRINGDVTPRPPTNGFITPPTFASSSSSSLSSRHTSQSQNGNGNGHGHGVLGQAGALGRHKHPHAHPHAHHHSNQSQSQGQTQTQSQTQRAPLGTERALVPFEPDSELWPYTRATTTGHSRGNSNGSHNNNNVNVNNNGNNNHSTPTTSMNPNGSGEHEHQYEDKDEDEDEDEEQILELDFEDTSALSDPDAFRRRRGGGGGGAHAHAHGNAHGNALSNDNGAGTGERKRVRTKRKMTRKERVAEHAREREEIERSWDAPAPAPPTATAAGAGAGAGALAYGEMGTDMDMEGMEPMSPELCPSEPELQPEPVVRHGNGNRNGNGAEKKKEKEMGKAKGKQVVYPNPSPYPELRDGQKVVPEAVRDSVVEAAVKAKPAAALERNEFVREVLTLIHTDRAFVDSLYKEYTSRVRAEA